jgi:hypothetical protein
MRTAHLSTRTLRLSLLLLALAAAIPAVYSHPADASGVINNGPRR